MRQNWAYYPLSQELVQVHVQPSFFLRTESHRLCPDRYGVTKAQLVVILRVFYFPDISLLGGKVVFTGNQIC
jgi:hypothetical protein